MKILALVLALAIPFTAAAPTLHDLGTLRESLNCTGLPSIPKFFDPTTFSWGGKDYLTVNTGNDLSVWNIENPKVPVVKAQSHFYIPNQGDSNYDLTTYSICDDCRWGIATFKLGNVLFDLGTGTTPQFAAKKWYKSGNPSGSFTFTFGGKQYLVGHKLPNDCGADATLYRINGINDIQKIGCVDVPTALPTSPRNGIKVEGVGGTFLYLSFSNTQTYIFKVRQSGDGVTLDYTGQKLLCGTFPGGTGLSVDRHANIAVTASFGKGLLVYDISNPAMPVVKSQVQGYVTVAAVKYPFVWAARAGDNNAIKTVNISNPARPRPLDQGFWDPSHPWNNHSQDCEWPNGAVFSPDASTLYLARHAVIQMVGVW